MQGVSDSFWRIKSFSVDDIFVKRKMGCRYHDDEEDDYQTIVLEPENEEDEERQKGQSEKIDLEIDKEIPLPIIID